MKKLIYLAIASMLMICALPTVSAAVPHGNTWESSPAQWVYGELNSYDIIAGRTVTPTTQYFSASVSGNINGTTTYAKVITAMFVFDVLDSGIYENDTEKNLFSASCLVYYPNGTTYEETNRNMNITQYIDNGHSYTRLAYIYIFVPSSISLSVNGTYTFEIAIQYSDVDGVSQTVYMNMVLGFNAYTPPGYVVTSSSASWLNVLIACVLGGSLIFVPLIGAIRIRSAEDAGDKIKTAVFVLIYCIGAFYMAIALLR